MIYSRLSFSHASSVTKKIVWGIATVGGGLFATNAYALTTLLHEARYALQQTAPTIASKSSLSLGENSTLVSDLRLGQRHSAIEVLKRHWAMDVVDNHFDKAFQTLLRVKQIEVELNPTGVLDRNSWYALAPKNDGWRRDKLNAGVESWTKIIEQHKNHVTPRMVVINLASGLLNVYDRKDDGSYVDVFQSRVVVGKPTSKTPLDHFEITSLKYNPTWTPTPRMLEANVYKEGTFDPTWLRQKGVEPFNRQGQRVDWSSIDNPRNFLYIQPPGNNNSLGNLKFETTSTKHISLHDTNEPRLFRHNTRTYSAGCIRVEDYKGLAALLGEKTIANVESGISRKHTHWVKLPKNVPVYFDTSVVRKLTNGSLVFSADLYGLDRNLKPSPVPKISTTNTNWSGQLNVAQEP